MNNHQHEPLLPIDMPDEGPTIPARFKANRETPSGGGAGLAVAAAVVVLGFLVWVLV